jgi:hypothetical protein
VSTPTADDAGRGRSRARRERQLGEIITALADGEGARAAGLAAEHRHEFPGDAVVLDALLAPRSPADRRC